MRSALKFKIDILAESWIEKKAFLAFESGWKIKLLTHPVNIFDLIFCWYFWYCADWPRRRNGRWWFVFGKMRILSNKNVHGQQAGRTDKEKEFQSISLLNVVDVVVVDASQRKRLFFECVIRVPGIGNHFFRSEIQRTVLARNSQL